MKRWYDTQIGVPLKAGVAGPQRINVTAQFAGGSGMLIANPTGRITVSQAVQFNGSSTLSIRCDRYIPAVARFSGQGTFFADWKFFNPISASATFAGNSGLSVVAKQQMLAAVSMVGAGTFSVPTSLLWHRWQTAVSFAGNSTFSADTIQKGRLQAVASFAGSGGLSVSAQQRMQVVAQFAGSGGFILPTSSLRQAAIANFAGAGIYNASANIITPTGGAPNAPVLILASLADDTTPDFNVDLPTGAGNTTDIQVNDILTIQSSANAGATWQAYVSRTLTSSDIAGVGFTLTAQALASGNYLFRAQLQRGGLLSAFSPNIAVTLTQPPAAPTLALLSANTDTTPDFQVGVPKGFGNDSDARVGDTALAQYSNNGGSTWSTSFTHVLVSGDLASGFVGTSTQLTNGNYLFRARIDRSTVSSPYSANVADNIQSGSTSSTGMFVRSAADKGEATNIGGNDSFTKLLLHMDGAQGSQTFIDSSASNHTIGAVGNYTQITNIQQFGTSCGAQNAGSADCLDINEGSASADFAFATGDFTIDFWFYMYAALAGFFYDGRPASTEGFYPTIATNGSVLRYEVNGADRIIGATGISLNVWHHFALARSGTSTKMFLDGVQQGSTYTDSGNYLNTAQLRPVIGNDSFITTNRFPGALDEFRVSKGIARWTANFTPPVAAYSVISGLNNLRLRAQTDKG